MNFEFFNTYARYVLVQQQRLGQLHAQGGASICTGQQHWYRHFEFYIPFLSFSK